MTSTIHSAPASTLEARDPRPAPAREKPLAPTLWNRLSPVFLHGLLILLCLTLHWLSDDPGFTLTAAGALVFLFYALLAYGEAQRTPLAWGPLSYHFAWYSNALGISAIYMGGRVSSGERIDFSVVALNPSDIAAAYIIYLIGSFALHAGIQLTRPLPSAPALHGAEASDSPPSTAGLIILWAIGIFARLFAPSLEFLGGVKGLLQMASIAALSVYVLTYGAQPRVRFWLILALGTVIEAAVSTRAGSKAALMYSFLPCLWLFAHHRRYRKWLIPLALSMIALYLTVVAPVINASRNLHWSEGANQTERIQRVFFSERRQSVDVGEQLEALLSRQFEPAPVAFLYREVERSGLRYGETMDYLAYAFIPRFFWPEKPHVTRGAWFTLYLGQARNEREVSTSTGQMAVGELYWNFGLLGVILGLIFLGAFIGALWRLAGVAPKNDGLLMVLYISLCLTMVDVAEAGTLLVSLVYRAIVIGSVIWILRYGRTLLPRNLKRARAF